MAHLADPAARRHVALLEELQQIRALMVSMVTLQGALLNAITDQFDSELDLRDLDGNAIAPERNEGDPL